MEPSVFCAGGPNQGDIIVSVYVLVLIWYVYVHAHQYHQAYLGPLYPYKMLQAWDRPE